VGTCHGALNAQLTAGQALPQLFSLCCSGAHDRLLASAWPPSVERLSLEQPSTTHGVPLNRQTTAIGRKIPPTKSLVDPSKPVSLGLVEPRDLQEIDHAEGDRDQYIASNGTRAGSRVTSRLHLGGSRGRQPFEQPELAIEEIPP